MHQRRLSLTGPVLAIAVLAALQACVPDAPQGLADTTPTAPTPDPVPTTGSFVASLEISGPEAPPDLPVSLDGAEPIVVAAGGTATWDDLEVGDHSVEVGDVPENCDVAGDNPRTVTIAPGLETEASFDVTCQATVGTILVTATTTGDGTDKDGYEVRLDDENVGRIDVNGTLELTGILPGEHEVRLRNVAKDCDVDGSATRLVVVVAGLVATVHYDVVCDD